MLVSRKPCQIERIWQTFWPRWYMWRLAFPSFNEYFTHQKLRPFLWVCKQTTLPNFQKKKKLPFPKMGAIINFQICDKSPKHQIASVCVTVQDRAISSKFFKHTVSKITTLAKNHFSYILALLSYKQNFLTWLSCHYFSFSGCFVLQVILWLYLYLYLPIDKLLYLYSYLQSFFCICPNPVYHEYKVKDISSNVYVFLLFWPKAPVCLITV